MPFRGVPVAGYVVAMNRPPARSGINRWTFAVTLVVVAGPAAACAAPYPIGAGPTTTVTRYITPAPSVAAPAIPVSAPNTMPTDGTYLVGTDIAPGTYKSAASHANNSSYCKWSRLSDLSGTSTAETATGADPGTTFVIITPADKAFKTQDCLPWELVPN